MLIESKAPTRIDLVRGHAGHLAAVTLFHPDGDAERGDFALRALR